MSDLVVRGGDVDVVVRDGVVVDGAAAPGSEVLDADGCLVVPGYLDLQCNGGFGIDLTAEPERLWELAEHLPRTGVTAWCPTIVTSPTDITDRARATLAAGPPPGWLGARPLGLHLEGPFLSPQRTGAHDRRHVSGIDAERAASWSAAGGVAIVTMAPELDGGLDLVRALVSRGVVVSAGHSDATEAEARAAIDAGASLVTHLFNAMAPLHHRAPGLAGVALADERVRVGIIADGVHVHPTTVAAAWAALRSRLVLVTDAVAALGTDAATDGGVRLPDGTLAGSGVPMHRAVRNLAEFAARPLRAAVDAATTTPAAVLGRTDVGHLRAGGRGDLVVLRPDGELVATVVGGVVAWRS
jgi:N-acetylglucosamine-6-phosphate deacetylase